jgi:hypothetical protein
MQLITVTEVGRRNMVQSAIKGSAISGDKAAITRR